MPQVQQSFDLTLAGAQSVLGAAIAKANELGKSFHITIADSSGATTLAARMDGAPRMAAGISANKASTVTGFGGMPTSRWWGAVKDNEALAHGIAHTPGFIVFGGGVGIFSDGNLVGAIGVSGGSPEEDEQVAEAGAAAIS